MLDGIASASADEACAVGVCASRASLYWACTSTLRLVPTFCAGDHLYRMDYRDFVRRHRASKAAITIAALPCDEKRASSFGLMKIDGTGGVTEFAEKPKGDLLKSMQVDTTILGVDPKT